MRRAPAERRRTIVELLAEGNVSVKALARRMSVSEISIRRDLAILKREGRLLRTYGGAMPNQRLAYEFSFKTREAQHKAQKEVIGRAAAKLVEPGSTVFLDTGTTTLAVARNLPKSHPSMIVTINLAVASEYVGQRDVRVMVPGGELGNLSCDLYGEWTLATLSGVNVDVAFLGCIALDIEDGFYAGDTKSAAVSELMLSRSQRRYLVVDSSKFGKRSVCRIGPITALTGIVTDNELPPRVRRAIEKAGLEVIVAPL